MKNKSIIGAIDAIRILSMQLVRSTSSLEYFDAIAVMSEQLKIIEKEVASIEAECERQKNQASKLRVMWGNELDKLCDEAGME